MFVEENPDEDGDWERVEAIPTWTFLMATILEWVPTLWNKSNEIRDRVRASLVSDLSARAHRASLETGSAVIRLRADVARVDYQLARMFQYIKIS